MYCTYLLYSLRFDRIYIGHTDKLRSRLGRHNSGKVKSTKQYVPWEQILYEENPSRSLEMKREKVLKAHKGIDFIRNNLLNGRALQLVTERRSLWRTGVEARSPYELPDILKINNEVLRIY